MADETACIAVPSFAEHQHVHPREQASKLPPPSRSREKANLGKPRASQGDRLIKPSGPSVNQALSTPKPPTGAISQIFDAWVASTGHTACKLDDKRRRVIGSRLADYPLDDVLDAVRGWERDPWDGRRQQNEITILLRDAAHLEKFRDLWRKPAVLLPQQAVGYDGPTELARKYW